MNYNILARGCTPKGFLNREAENWESRYKKINKIRNNGHINKRKTYKRY